MNKIIHGDCLEKLKELEDNSVDAVVTDPPYGLSFMGKKWDYDVPSVEIWQECLRVLKPGGYLLSFAGTRTQHRMAVRIEDAGFEIRDMIMYVYGSGFPKSRNVGLDVDKMNGVTGNRGKAFVVAGQSGQRDKDTGGDLVPGSNTMGAYKAQNEWSGWGTALKPALEPITVARKPLGEKTVAENVLKWGTGGINIDGCRVGTEEMGGGTMPDLRDVGAMSKEAIGIDKLSCGQNPRPALRKEQPTYNGRFPANLIHDGSDEVVGLFPQTKSGKMGKQHTRHTDGSPNGIYGKFDINHELGETYGDSGSASRFFYCAKASKSERNRGLDRTAIVLIECGICENNTIQEVKKVQLLVDMETLAPKDTEESGTQPKEGSEWNMLLFGKSLTAKYQKDIKSTILTETNLTTTSAIYNWLALLLTKEYIADVSLEKTDGGNLAENAENSNILITTINEKMASVLGVKGVQSGMQLKISVKEGRSSHPTVKPIALMEYLVKLVSREGAVVLDPFAGSGSTLIACKNLNRQYIGIEREDEYIKIINARLK